MSAWTAYVLFSVLLVFLADRIVFARFQWLTRMPATISCIALLLTPAAVSGTQSLAPAWFVASFEIVFGSEEAARIALLPLVVCLLIVHVVFFGVIFWRRRRMKNLG